VKMFVGLILLLSAILASLQTFLKYSEQAENHRNASSRYQSLHHSIEQLLVIPLKDEQALIAFCDHLRDHLRDRWDELNLETPIISQYKEELIESGNEPEPSVSTTKHKMTKK